MMPPHLTAHPLYIAVQEDLYQVLHGLRKARQREVKRRMSVGELCREVLRASPLIRRALRAWHAQHPLDDVETALPTLPPLDAPLLLTRQEFRRLRKEARLSQEQLGRLMGYSRSHIQHLEMGYRTLSTHVSALAVRIMAEQGIRLVRTKGRRPRRQEGIPLDTDARTG